MNERYTSAAWGGVGKTCLFSCLGALRTSTLCLEIEKKMAPIIKQVAA